MAEILTELFNLDNWRNYWGFVVVIVIPITFLILHFWTRNFKIEKELLVFIQVCKFILIPSFVIQLVMIQIIKIESQHKSLLITETIITIIFAYLFVILINKLLLSEDNILTGKQIIPKLGRDVINLVVMIFTSAMIFSNVWSIDLGSIITALGVGSLVLGLALQEPLGNLFNGIALLMAKPFTKGDWIIINGNIGKAIEINWRSVKIISSHNEEIILPNNLIAKEKIVNLSHPSRIHANLLKIGFSYESSPTDVKNMLLQLARDNEKILNKPQPIAMTLSYDDYCITYGVRYYINDYKDNSLIENEILSAIYYKAKAANIVIPYPRYDLNVINNY